MNPYNLLKLLEELESEMAVLYRRFQLLYESNVEAGVLFGKLCADEIAHRNIVAYLLRLVVKNPKEFSVVKLETGELVEMIRQRKKMSRVESPLHLADALQLAVRLENSLIEHHFRAAAAEANPQMAKMCRSLGRADESHLLALKALADSKGLTS